MLGPLPADTLFNPRRSLELTRCSRCTMTRGYRCLNTRASFWRDSRWGFPSSDFGGSRNRSRSCRTGRAEVGSLVTAIELAAELALHGYADAVLSRSPAKRNALP